MADLPPNLESAPDVMPAALPVPPEVANALRNLEQVIFGTYASTSARSNAFDLLLDLQATLHRAPTRASLVPPKPLAVAPGMEGPECR